MLRLEALLTAFYFAFTRFNLKGAKILHDLSRGAKNLHDLNFETILRKIQAPYR